MVSPSRVLRVGLLGCGRIAQRYHLPLLAGLRDVVITAVAEQDSSQRELCLALAPQAAWFEHYQDLLASADLDAAIICLPPALHAAAASACFAHGLHVYLEKPLATSLDEGRSVLRAWRQAGTIGWMGFNLRFHPLLIGMRDALGCGQIGKLLETRAAFCSASGQLPGWKSQRSTGGGALLELASHQFDLLRFLTGQEIVELSAFIASHSSEDDCAEVQLRLSGGTLVQIFSALGTVEQHRVELVGSAGQLEFDRYQSSRLNFRPARRDFSRRARAAAAVSLLAGLPRNLRDCVWPPREMSIATALSAFAQAVRGENVSGADLDEGYRSLAAVLAAEQAAHSGQRVLVVPAA